MSTVYVHKGPHHLQPDISGLTASLGGTVGNATGDNEEPGFVEGSGTR